VSIVVLDTNTIVSGTINPDGAPGQVLAAGREERFVWVISSVIIAEVFTALNRDRIRNVFRLIADDIQQHAAALERETVHTAITHEVHGVATHPEVDLILATAVSAAADYLVTGDKQLQALGSYGGVLILSPRAFLDVLEAERA